MCYAHQMRRNILIQFGERKRCRIEGPFSQSFSNMNKDGIPKISSCNTVPPRPLHPRKHHWQNSKVTGMRISRIKHVQVDGGSHDRKWRRSWEVWGQEEPGDRADTGCCSMLNVYMEHESPVSWMAFLWGHTVQGGGKVRSKNVPRTSYSTFMVVGWRVHCVCFSTTVTFGCLWFMTL